MIPVVSMGSRGWQVAVDGHVFLSQIEPWICDFPGEDTRTLCFQPPAENGVVLDVCVDVAGTQQGTAHVDLRLERDGREDIEAGIVDVAGVRTIVAVDYCAPGDPVERVLLALFGPYRGTFRDAHALVDELARLGSMPVSREHVATQLGRPS